MNKLIEAVIAWCGVFCGSLLWDVLFGDGIQADDWFEAFSVGLVAACMQFLISHYRARRDWH